MVAQIAKWGNDQGIRMDKHILNSLGLSVGDTVELLRSGENIIIKPIHEIDWYLTDYERPLYNESWEHFRPKGREEW